MEPHQIKLNFGSALRSGDGPTVDNHRCNAVIGKILSVCLGYVSYCKGLTASPCPKRCLKSCKLELEPIRYLITHFISTGCYRFRVLLTLPNYGWFDFYEIPNPRNLPDPINKRLQIYWKTNPRFHITKPVS